MARAEQGQRKDRNGRRRNMKIGNGVLLLFLGLILISCQGERPVQDTSQRSEIIQPQNWWEKLPRLIYSSLERIKTSQEWFEVYKLVTDTFAIYEPYQFEEAISYLVLGKERGILVDTGTGIGNLRKLVSELTDLPVSVVNTHTHWDHIGANHQFERIACFNHPECIDKLLKGVGNTRLQPSITDDSIWKPLPKELDPSSWEIPPVKPTQFLEDGDIIDLGGGRTLEVIYTPGHSPGSICLLDKKYRILFTGDTFFPGPLYAYPEDVDIDDYRASIDRLIGRVTEYDYLCSGHNDPWVKSEVIPRVAQAFQTILAGEGDFKQDGDLRRYYFEGFDILIRTDMIIE
jgi:glyoxylase-like metal-dependent hydrolase (beta-lactamase superfamily II)